MNRRIFTIMAVLAMILGGTAAPAQAVSWPPPVKPPIQCITTPCVPDGTRVKPIPSNKPRFCYNKVIFTGPELRPVKIMICYWRH